MSELENRIREALADLPGVVFDEAVTAQVRGGPLSAAVPAVPGCVAVDHDLADERPRIVDPAQPPRPQRPAQGGLH